MPEQVVEYNISFMGGTVVVRKETITVSSEGISNLVVNGVVVLKNDEWQALLASVFVE